MYAVKSGVGIGPLPTAIADAEQDLVRVLGPIPELARSWRLLTHPDLRRTPRISAFFDFIIEEREALEIDPDRIGALLMKYLFSVYLDYGAARIAAGSRAAGPLELSRNPSCGTFRPSTSDRPD